MADIDRQTEPVGQGTPARMAEPAGDGATRDLNELYRRFAAYLAREDQNSRQGQHEGTDSHWDRTTADALMRAHEAIGAARATAAHHCGSEGTEPEGSLSRTSSLANAARQAGGSVVPELARMEERINRLGARLEQAVSTALSGNATAALGARLAAFEQRLGTALDRVASRADVDGLKLVEAHVIELSQNMGAALNRLESIEAQLAYLIGHLPEVQANPRREHHPSVTSEASGLAEAIAQHLARRSPDHTSALIAEMRHLLEAYLGRHHAEDRQRAAALDRVRGELLHLTERLGAVEREIGATRARTASPHAAETENWAGSERLAEAYHGGSDPYPADEALIASAAQWAQNQDSAAAFGFRPERPPADGLQGSATPPPLPCQGSAATGARSAARDAGAQPGGAAGLAPRPRGDFSSTRARTGYSGAFLGGLALLVALGAGLTAYGVLWAGSSSTPMTAAAAAMALGGRLTAVAGGSPQGPASAAGPEHAHRVAGTAPAQPGASAGNDRENPPSSGVPGLLLTNTAPPGQRGGSPGSGSVTGEASAAHKAAGAPGGLSAREADPHDVEGLAHALAPAVAGPLSLRVAGASGDPSAQFAIALRFAQVGPQRDMAQAFLWFQRAALKGFAPAQYRLAGLYERGLGVPSDFVRAREWYKRAAEQGHVKAMHNLAVFAARGRGGLIDYAEAARWFGEAAERGLRDSQFNRAIFYESGLGVRQDPVQAYKWFSLAARNGDRDAERRRDTVAEKIDAQRLAQAQALAQGWTPTPMEPFINDARLAAEAWKVRWPELG